MSMYPNRLQPALQNLLQHVVWFFHLRMQPGHIYRRMKITHKASDVAENLQPLISPLMRGLAPSPQGASGSLRWSVIRMEDPQEDPLAVHCFCICSRSALLGDLLGVSRSRERDLQSVCSVYLS